MPPRTAEHQALRVFLCHSSGDKTAVRELCRRLKSDGFDPWLDEEALLPGQDWSDQIPKALRDCHAVVICVSRNSVNKEGYLQREIRAALAVAEEKPDNAIFIIPVKLESVEIPANLSRWQFADLSSGDGYSKLLAALNRRSVQMGVAAPLQSPGPRGRLVLGFALLLLLVAAVFVWMHLNQSSKRNPKDGLTYNWIPAGTFMMGCSPVDAECGDNEKPAHRVTISKGFWMGQTEVTVAAYRRHVAGAAIESTDHMLPITNVSWDDAAAFCEWAGGRLPTEAEWEYAARGGAIYARYGPVNEIAWYSANSHGRAQEVAQKRANGYGLYDMLGNAFEWVSDGYSADYYARSPDLDPQGPSGEPASHVIRGGSWYFPFPPRAPHVSDRLEYWPDFGSSTGFRCVLTDKAR